MNSSLSARPLHYLFLAFMLAMLAGCTTPSTATRKDLNVLLQGTPRTTVVKEFGNPVSTSTGRDGDKIDVFKFVQGTAPSKKPANAVEPEQAETVEWMALLEQAGLSPNAMLAGKSVTMQVIYDADERVKDTILLRLE